MNKSNKLIIVSIVVCMMVMITIACTSASVTIRRGFLHTNDLRMWCMYMWSGTWRTLMEQIQCDTISHLKQNFLRNFSSTYRLHGIVYSMVFFLLLFSFLHWHIQRCVRHLFYSFYVIIWINWIEITAPNVWNTWCAERTSHFQSALGIRQIIA